MPPTPLPPLDCLIGSHYVGAIIIIQGFFTAVPQSARALARGPVTRRGGHAPIDLPCRESSLRLPTFVGLVGLLGLVSLVGSSDNFCLDQSVTRSCVFLSFPLLAIQTAPKQVSAVDSI